MNERERKPKELDKIGDFEKRSPSQLALFELNSIDERRSYLMGLYDALPKWVQEQPKYIEGRFLDPIIKEISYKGIEFEIVLFPAKIEVSDKKYIDKFPGRREEIIEQAVRKLSFKANQRAILDHIKDQERKNLYSGFFTLNELREELKSIDHTYNLDEIKEGLRILSRTVVYIKSKDGKIKIDSPIFPSLGLREKDNSDNLVCFVQFHSLISQSVLDRSARLFEYRKNMECKTYIARYLHKRLSDVFTQAGVNQVYNIALSTLLRDAGVSNKNAIRDNITMVEDSLFELITIGVLYSNKHNYDVHKNARDWKYRKAIEEGYELRERKTPVINLGFQTFVKKEKRKIVEAKFFLYPSDEFTSEMIRANQYKQCMEYNIHPNAK